MLIALIGLATVTISRQRPRDVTHIEMVAPIWPDYTEVTIPVGIAPLSFNFIDEKVQNMHVVVRGEKGGKLTSNGKYAEFSINKWHKLLEENRGARLIVSVTAKIQGRWLEYNDFNIFVSDVPLDDWGVTYRRIVPGYEAGGNIGIYQRNIHNYFEEPILAEYSVPTHCFNCHTANRCDPKQFTMQLRGEHGATILQMDGVQQYLNTRTDTTRASCSYTYWHPSGDYIAFNTSAVFQAFFTGKQAPKEVYHTFSDIAIFDTRTNELILDERVRSENVEIFPAFSADGKTLYYSSNHQHPVPDEYEKIKCSLCSIGFDAATGTFVGEVDTLLNGVADDCSYVLARPSYDGKWLMYTRMDHSNWSAEERSSDLWMMNLSTGECKELTILNSPYSDGYHNWSSNSRWVVYASKCYDGLYGRLFFTLIDEEGNATKPFLLPQKNPRKYYDRQFDSYNAPDFTIRPVEFDVREARKEIFSDVRMQVTIRQKVSQDSKE